MTDVLAEICAEKHAHIARAKVVRSEAALLAAISEAPPVRPFAAALERHLAEVHDRAELDRALRLPVRLIGINNRNLKTLETDLRIAETLAPEVPADRIVVAESGIRRPEDLDRLAAAGAHCFLVGETLMREPDVTAATRRLLGFSAFTHLDAEGRARMVDVSDKQETDRVALAGAR